VTNINTEQKKSDNSSEKTVEDTKLNKGTPYEIVQIYDTSCNKIRKARNFKISSFEEYGEDGNVRMSKSVEFIIVGNNRTWKMFVPFNDFVKANPQVNLPGA